MVDEMIAEYNKGELTIEQIARKFGISTGKAYYMLRDAGCEFSRKWRREMTAEERARISALHKGKHLTQEQIEAIRQRNSCNYNGLNGYGHTKQHCAGYILAYAPKHPNAHKDGYVMLHTVLMEQKIGRYLNADEVVHHINHNKADNRLENLQLMNKKDHQSMHMTERHAKRRNDLLTA